MGEGVNTSINNFEEFIYIHILIMHACSAGSGTLILQQANHIRTAVNPIEKWNYQHL